MTGASSTTRTRGTVTAGDAQKTSMPVRVMATTVASPDSTNAASSAQVVGDTPAPPGDSRGLSMANLARNPDSGGSPARRMAQATKLDPRIAIVAGMGTPT